ncbi:PREDICTED: uncharacterized protein LOC104806212 isoform X2 [Tarenaya hassleriana]|uniref:uncharacterized protein LOC104806212 isoform X2 n=1 Tax=Tarenaya hassleriana TaxID=28532 RepID=UPI00053C9201|nr:PREDICTED: uncharacterized protein LOC104806212 isoform X2 [Tarenaya hassleriana]
MGVGICNCSLPLPPPHARNLRFVSSFRLIRHAVIHFPGISLVPVAETHLRCNPGGFEPEALAFPDEFRFKDNSSDNLIPSEDASVAGEKNKSIRIPKDGDLVRLEGEDDPNKSSSGGGKQMVKRSNLMAKQVISVQSALGLGFISQLWVDTTSWLVLAVEVKPSLLSGESDRFLLKDIVRVGDVVLVEDESVLENEFKRIGLETLVGYKVETPGRRSIGKVRSYKFDIISGTIELLELDSFGISIIPSSLVSTYGLHVEDIIEVVSDIVVIHEAAASRIQRLTKFAGEYSDIDRSHRRRRRRRDGRSSRSRRKKRGDDDDDDDDDDNDGWGIFY